ncbi:helix-turn-helix domain-containing protein [Streptomyces sp. NBC_00654]|uniref:helix-turn-helix domain-containing protein n=1 Tax=Streptomyces sp. NBC_00654 TaxID=2975799 RepID=UPI002250181F|nr:transcriptional regulator [Streptomyces sp. NBC_00654]MCX4966765.1 helix-turn-helix domain-containing protein [Streptomyces sp. NBC_00654]
MGRRENPIAQCGKSLFALATWLRAGRDEAGLTYHQLAARTDFSADTLARAASGRSVPQNPNVVTSYARACGRGTKEAERLWKHARRDEVRAQGVLTGHRGGAHISVVKDFADLHSAIVDLYQDDGSPPLRSLDPRLGSVGRLPRSTAGRVLKGRSTPGRDFVLAFAEACGVRKADLAEWGKAWDRADADRSSTRARHRRKDRLVTHDRITPRDLQLLMSDLESSARKKPGLKLLVNIPHQSNGAGQKSARMTRELLVDQAQRRGELACPRCRRPSFGYNDARGWTAALCADCAPARASEPSAPHAPDTPTLVLRIPAAPPRDPLPRRVPQQAWPRPADPEPAPPQNADAMATLDDPPPAGPPRPPDWFRPPAGPGRPYQYCPCPDCQGPDRTPDRTPPPAPAPSGTTLTTRIRINIPGSRPVPPVVLRTPPASDDR